MAAGMYKTVIKKASNKHLGGGVPKEEYVKVREERDATLNLPDRMLYALQFNLRGGRRDLLGHRRKFALTIAHGFKRL